MVRIWTTVPIQSRLSARQSAEWPQPEPDDVSPDDVSPNDVSPDDGRRPRRGRRPRPRRCSSCLAVGTFRVAQHPAGAVVVCQACGVVRLRSS